MVTFEALRKAASALGLTVEATDRGSGVPSRYAVSVGREAPDWQMERRTIAIGQTEPVVVRQSLAALNQIAPQLRKRLQDDAPEPDQVGLAAGLSADGTVTALRVERDGSVRLHPDDIEAIAAAVLRRMRPPVMASVHEGEFIVPPGFFMQGEP